MKKEKLIVIIASCLVFTVALVNTDFGEKTHDAIDPGPEKIHDFTETSSGLEKEDFSGPQYSSQELINLGLNAELSVEYIKDNYRIDAERKFDNGIGYIMIISEDGGRFYLAFTEDEENNINRREYWYCGKKVLSDEFDVLSVGISTFDDVLNLDPNCDYVGFQTSYTKDPYQSYHATYDGYYITITYEIKDDAVVSETQKKASDKALINLIAVVSEIQKEKAPDNALINLILDEDMPEW